MSEPIIRFKNVYKSYATHEVLKDFNLDVQAGEFITIIGRSGCGKTTVIKLINGLITPNCGQVYVQGQNVGMTSVVALRRRIGYVIQNVGLFPHMTVEKNIGYVPSISRMSAWSKGKREEKIFSLLKQVGLDPALQSRYPRELSGGQRQRVGIARALAASPDILLMDEPFGAVDEITRNQLQDEILRIHQDHNLTILFVTHDIGEALKLGTRTMVMEAGGVLQCAPPSQLLKSPASPFVAKLVCRSREFAIRA